MACLSVRYFKLIIYFKQKYFILNRVKMTFPFLTIFDGKIFFYGLSGVLLFLISRYYPSSMPPPPRWENSKEDFEKSPGHATIQGNLLSPIPVGSNSLFPFSYSIGHCLPYWYL